MLLVCLQQANAGGVRVIQNPDFEIRKDGSAVSFPPNAGLNSNSTWAYWGDSTCGFGNAVGCIAGWYTTDIKNGTTGQPSYNGPYIEVGYASTYGHANSVDANRIVAELNATQQSRLYQPICLQAGETITMNYYFSARSNGGSLPQQVAAGLWAINNTGPIGGALSSQNSNFSSSAAFTPQTAVFSAPSDGLYQIGLEAVLPNTGSNGNLIDNIRVVLKPLIDLNTSPKFTMPEGSSGSSLQLRVNGTVETPTVVALRKISGAASSDIDFNLGTPVGLAGTTPTISHVTNSDLWLVTIPAGEYDAGQGIFGNAKYGIQIPVNSVYDVLREGTEPLIFELQAPSNDGADPISKWDRTNPICEGASTNIVEADIIEVLPVVKVHKNVIGRVNAADQFTTIIKDSGGNVVSSTTASLTAGGGVTTSGATTGLFTATGKFEADFDQTYTISEVMTAGSANTLNAYTSSISCTNARVIGPATVLPSGVGQSFTVSPQDSDDIDCTITNAPLPVITLNKALASTRAAPNDQFTVQIKQGASVVNSITNSTSTGAGSTITGATGTTGATILQPNTYTLTEVAAGSPLADLSLYNTFISCTNTYGASSTVLPSGNGQSFSITPQGNDNISCTLTNIAHQPRIALQKALSTSGRLNAADQFTVQLKQGASVVSSGTTTGAGSTVAGGLAGPTFVSAGVTYTLTEVMAGGSVSALSAYSSRIVCTNTNGSSGTVLPSGNGNSFSITPQLDDVISCTLTNGKPRLRVNKSVTSVWNGTDRFTTQIKTGGVGGTVVSNTTTGGGTLTNNAVGNYTAGGYFLGKVGTVYTITEAISGASSNIANYSTSISCTNATSGSSTVLPTGTATSFDITPQFNDDITCTLTNITHPRIAFSKALSSARASNSDQFLMRLQGGVAPVIDITTLTTGTGSTVTNGAIAATQVVAATSYTLSETASGTTSLPNYNARISCTNNYGTSVTTLPTGAGTSFSVTPQLGDDISCILTNGREPRIKLNKTIATGLVDATDKFTTQIRDNTSSKTIVSSTSSSPLTGGAVTSTGGVGSYIAAGVYMANSGTTYNLTEDITAGTSGKSQYDTTISCTNNGVAMGSPSGSGQNFTITPATGDNIVCTLTNSPKAPRITLNKNISGVIDNITPVDTFRTRIYNGVTLLSDGSSANGTVLTNNTSSTVFPQTYSAATAFTGSAGTTYTLTEASASGSTPIANYATFIDCINTRNDGPFTIMPDGAGQSFNFTPKHGDNVTCTFDNGPAQILLRKALVNNRTANTNQFTMEIRNGSTVLNSAVASTTAGQNNIVTPGSGTTDITYVAGGGTYNLREVASGGTTMTDYETRIDCTNAKVGSTTVLPSTPLGTFNATQSYNVTPVTGDVIDCVFSNKRTAPRIRIAKVLGGLRYDNTDQFSLQVRDAANTTTLNSVNTTGTGSTVSGSVNYSAAIGTTYTIREVMASGTSALSDYINSYSCINNATGVTTTGTATSLSFTAAKYDDLECTFTNTPRPRIKVNKTVNVSLIDSADRFTTQIRRTSDNTLLSGTSSSATTGGGVATGAIVTFPSTATATGTYQAVAGTSVTLTEAISAGSSVLSQYQSEISCTNAYASSTTVLPSGTTQPFAVVPQNGDSITCIITNTPLPRLKVSKVVASIADATDRFTTQIRTGGVSGTVVSGTSSSATVGGGVVTTAGVGTYNAAGKYQAIVGTSYSFTEILSAGASNIAQYSNTFSCTNSYAGSTTPMPTGAYPYQVTPQLGDDISCTLTNNTVAPKIRVNKTVVALADIDDRFITQIRTGGVSGTVVSNPNSSATVGGGVFTTGGAGTYSTLGVYAATVGTTYTFTEVFAAGTSGFSQYTTSMSCTNARTAGPVTTLPSGTTAPFNVTPKAGDDITCTLSNDIVQPKIRVHKTVSSLVDANDRFTTEIRTGGVSGTVVSGTSASATVGGGVLSTGGVATYNATGTYQGVMATTYTLTESISAGTSNLAQYDTSVSCTNTRPNGPATILPTGSTQPFNIVAQAGDDISCTLTNIVRQPKIKLNKTVLSLLDANDRFTTQIRTGGMSGAVVSDTSASTTTDGGVSTTGGVATYNATGIYQGLVGTTYTLTEVMSAGTSIINQYATTVSCTNAYAASTTVLPTASTQPFNIAAQAGDDITCTLSNIIKQPLIRVHKSVLSLIDNNDRFITHIRTGGVSGAIVSDTSASATTGGGALTTGGAAVYNALGSYQAAIGTSYTLTEAMSAGTSILAQYGSSMSCINMWTGSPTVLPTGSTAPFNVTPIAGDDIRCTFTNTANAYSITGKVFLDNGKNAAIPHNGILEADETGLGNITVQLTDCAATVHQSTVTNGAGIYSLAIPNGLLAGATLCVVEQPSTNLISVSGVAGTTGGAYSLALDRTQFTLSAATNYTGVDFGNVAESQLTSTGNQTIAAGTTASLYRVQKA